MENVKRKCYFVQDYEPLFYPAGSTSSLVEATYKFGFDAICNTEPLAELYRSHGGRADFFIPAVDKAVFNDINRYVPNSSDPVIIFNYARPGHPRNCFELISAALKQTKKIFGKDIRIITAGADWSPAQYGLEDTLEHLGLLSYEETGELYRCCDIGVVAMATRHPSYLPLELMACGTAVCTNQSKYTDWVLQNNINSALFDFSVTSIVDTLSHTISNKEFRDMIVCQGSKDIELNHSSWDSVCEKILHLTRYQW